MLKQRDELLEHGGNSQQTAEMSQTVRTNLKGIKEEVEALSTLQKKEAKKTKVRNRHFFFFSSKEFEFF